jgi:DNA-binding NarL/FixJ family response regulator
VSSRHVVIISSYKLFRDGLKRLLDKVALVEFADSIEEVEELVHQQQVDAVIIDQAENQMTGNEVISRLLSLPGVRVITVSLTGDEMQVYRYEQVGKASVEDLIQAVLE